MKKYVLKRIKEQLELLHEQWAQNYVALEYNKVSTTAEAKKQVEAAKFQMSEIEKKIEWFRALQKKESR